MESFEKFALELVASFERITNQFINSGVALKALDVTQEVFKSGVWSVLVGCLGLYGIYKTHRFVLDQRKEDVRRDEIRDGIKYLNEIDDLLIRMLPRISRSGWIHLAPDQKKRLFGEISDSLAETFRLASLAHSRFYVAGIAIGVANSETIAEYFTKLWLEVNEVNDQPPSIDERMDRAADALISKGSMFSTLHNEILEYVGRFFQSKPQKEWRKHLKFELIQTQQQQSSASSGQTVSKPGSSLGSTQA